MGLFWTLSKCLGLLIVASNCLVQGSKWNNQRLAAWENQAFLDPNLNQLAEQATDTQVPLPNTPTLSATVTGPIPTSTCAPAICNCPNDQTCAIYRDAETSCEVASCLEIPPVPPCLTCPASECPQCGSNQQCQLISPGECYRCPVVACVPIPCLECEPAQCPDVCPEGSLCKVVTLQSCFQCPIAKCTDNCVVCPEIQPICNCKSGQDCILTSQTCQACATATCVDPPISDPCQYCQPPDICAKLPDGSRACVSVCNECPPVEPCTCSKPGNCIFVPRTCEKCAEYRCKEDCVKCPKNPGHCRCRPASDCILQPRTCTECAKYHCKPECMKCDDSRPPQCNCLDQSKCLLQERTCNYCAHYECMT